MVWILAYATLASLGLTVMVSYQLGRLIARAAELQRELEVERRRNARANGELFAHNRLLGLDRFSRN